MANPVSTSRILVTTYVRRVQMQMRPTYTAVVRPLVHNARVKNTKTRIYDAAVVIVWVCECVARVVVGGIGRRLGVECHCPVPTRRQRYCDPASLVTHTWSLDLSRVPRHYQKKSDRWTDNQFILKKTFEMALYSFSTIQRHKKRFRKPLKQFCDGLTDQLTDRWTNRPTKKWLIESTDKFMS